MATGRFAVSIRSGDATSQDGRRHSHDTKAVGVTNPAGELALAHLNLDVRDLAASAAFYGDALRLSVERREESLAIRHPSFLLVLARGEPQVGGTFHFGFRVATRDDVDAWVSRVRAMGSPVLLEPRRAGDVYVARIADPDAYEIEIYADVPGDATTGAARP